jgi:hypothetical protein
VIRSNFRKIHTKYNQTVPNSTKQYQIVPYRTFFGKLSFFKHSTKHRNKKILNMFDSIKLIKHYIFFNKIKIFSMFDGCLRRCKHQTF